MNVFRHSRKHVHDLIGRQERYSRYRGTARIDISHLKLDRAYQGLRFDKVERLTSLFASEGCHRLEPANRIAVIVSQQEFARLLLDSNLFQLNLLCNADTEDEFLRLTLSSKTTLRVFHGQHRLKATKSYLFSNDAWWTIDLFFDGKIKRIK